MSDINITIDNNFTVVEVNPVQIDVLVGQATTDIEIDIGVPGIAGPPGTGGGGSGNYEVQIESTGGNIFRPGQGLTTTLIAHVFVDGTEVTDFLSASRFQWRRVSYAPLPPPNDDASWNLQYISGHKQVEITADSITSRATYHCDILV